MKRLGILLFLIACVQEPESAEVREWLAVLERKTTAAKTPPEARLAAQQAYADALVAFVDRYPAHHRAREAYEALALEHARELAARGDYDRALATYEHLLARHPRNDEARAEMMKIRDQRNVTPAEIEQIRPGMAFDEVRAILGEPPRGWTKRNARAGKPEESWYYRRPDGKAAMVFFVGGKVVRAQY